jgi:hypothetical protein
VSRHVHNPSTELKMHIRKLLQETGVANALGPKYATWVEAGKWTLVFNSKGL